MKTQVTHRSEVFLDNRTGGGEFLEARALCCCGCQRVVILNHEREQHRHYCRSCDSFMCDSCALTMKVTGSHTPFVKVMNDLYEAASRNVPLLGAANG